MQTENRRRMMRSNDRGVVIPKVENSTSREVEKSSIRERSQRITYPRLVEGGELCVCFVSLFVQIAVDANGGI